MTNLKQYRHRGIRLLEDEIKSDTPNSFDYLLDDYLRDKLDLPKRPKGSKPYVGWMMPLDAPSDKERETSEQGVSFIKSHEGLRLNAYRCPGNVWTIGYGHTKSVMPGMRITEARAVELLKLDLQVYEDAVNNLVKATLNQNQFDALVSFTFNVGVGALGNSTLLKLLNDGSYKSAADQFLRWVHGGGQKLPGLVRRRNEERSLFLS